MDDTKLKNKQKEWAIRASKKSAIVPKFFEVFSNRVNIECGYCGHFFKRSLIVNIDEPTFVCPNCNIKNWVPIKYDLK